MSEKKGPSCPNWGQGGGGLRDSGNARKKTFFFPLMSSLISNNLDKCDMGYGKLKEWVTLTIHPSTLTSEILTLKFRMIVMAIVMLMSQSMLMRAMKLTATLMVPGEEGRLGGRCSG